MSLFSLIIPTYNRAELLRVTLESVFAQTFADYEVIVVDDGSTDGTRSYLVSLGGRIQVFTQSNQGPGAARNLGASHAAGEYLAFLDSDDVFFPWTLETYGKVIEQWKRPAFIAGKPLRFQAEDELSAVVRDEMQMEAFPDYLASGDQWRWWGVSSFVIRRDAFKAVNGFAKEWINGEDADLALRLGETPGFIQVTAPVTFGYREHAVSAMKNLNRTLAGVRYALRAEQESAYPGGSRRARQRWTILTRHMRPVSLACLQQGMCREAWELYRTTFGWQVSLGHWKYVLGFPVKAWSIRP